MALGLIFGGCIILIYQKMKLQSKNYEILNKQKLQKKIYIYLPLTCFLFRNSLTTIYSRTIISSFSGMSCINIKKEGLTLSSFCRSQLGLILRVGLTLKSSSKITLGLILRVGLIIGKHGINTRLFVCVNQVLFVCLTTPTRSALFASFLSGRATTMGKPLGPNWK